MRSSQSAVSYAPHQTGSSAKYDLGDQYLATDLNVMRDELLAEMPPDKKLLARIGGHDVEWNRRGSVYEKSAVRWSAHGWVFALTMPLGSSLPQTRAASLTKAAAAEAIQWSSRFLPGGSGVSGATYQQHLENLALARQQSSEDSQLIARSVFFSSIDQDPGLRAFVAKAELDPKHRFIMNITMEDRWLLLPHAARIEMARQLWQLWAAKNRPNQSDPDGDDNCPFKSNPGQKDKDGDGRGDVCDRDGITHDGGGRPPTSDH